MLDLPGQADLQVKAFRLPSLFRLGELPLVLLPLDLVKLSCLALDLLSLLKQLDKHPDLRLEYFRHDGFEQIVHRADRITLEHMDFTLPDRRQEDDWRALSLFALADERGRLEPVHARHQNVEQNDGKLIVEEPLQRLRSRAGLDEVLPQPFQSRFEREQVIRLVVDQQDVHLVIAIRRRHLSQPDLS